MKTETAQGARKRAVELGSVHRKIKRQADEMWRLYHRSGGLPAPGWRFPAIVDLYEHVLGALRASRSSRLPRSVSYEGKRYPIEVTSFGRVRVLCPETKRLLVSGEIGDAW